MMRESLFIINCTDDCLYLPLDGRPGPLAGRFLRVPLVWTGQRYLLPIDNAEDQAVELVFYGGEEQLSPLVVEYEHRRVASSRDWEKLERALSNAAGRDVGFNRTGGRFTRARDL